jgi:hypothetical protein
MVFLAQSLVLALVQISAGASVDRTIPAGLDRAVLHVVADTICRNTKRGYSVLSSNAAAVSARYGDRGLDPALALALVERNRSSPPLPTGIDCKRLHVADASLIERALNSPPKIPQAWDGFFAAFPGATGITYLSLPSYSSSFNEALVYVSGVCGSLCGSGFYWHLRMIDNQWKVVATIGLWIA